MLLALSMAQTFFVVAFIGIVAFVGFFALYVLSSTVWADRWVRRPGK
jgi:hypothetical protein